MGSIVTVTTARTDVGLLVDLEALKDELQITTTTNDDYLEGLLLRVSEAIETHCHRVFAVETVSEVFRPDAGAKAHEALILTRRPVIAITSVTADGTLLAASEYEVDKESGLLYRLSDDARSTWSEAKITVVYSSGYATIPGPVQQGIFELVKLNQAARTRDPALRSENILEGLYSYTLFNGENLSSVLSGVSGLDKYINRTVA